MCGIIACRTSEPAVDYLRTALGRLEYRGYDSVGIAVKTTTGDLARLRTVGRLAALDQLVSAWDGPQFGGVGIGHTRWATHGAVTVTNAHPHVDCTGQLSVVHNGVIGNADVLRDALTADGHQFASTVDSEVLCHLIEDARMHCGDLFDAVQMALDEVEGSWALAVLEADSGRVVVAAHGSPLLIAHTLLGDFAASDFAAVADWADEYRVLEDGDVVELTCNGRWSRRGNPALPTTLVRSQWRSRDIDLGEYSDYMAKEIDEQPEMAYRLIEDLTDRIANGALWSELELPRFDRLRVVGCGTSLNAGRVIGAVAGYLGGLPTTLSVASETGEEVADADQLCLAISQSGETADVLSAVRSDGVGSSPILALTNNIDSTLARRSDAVLTCNAGPEIGVAATKTFICQIIAGSALVMSALVATNRLSASCASRLVDNLRRVPDQLAAAATIAKCVVPSLVEGMELAGGFIYIARGTGVPYAFEGALKLKELTYRWADACPAGELKHGPLALITDGTPVIVIGNGDAKLATNVAEVRARGGRLITIGPSGSDVPVVGDPYAPWGPIAATVPLQVIARTVALALGRDVDKPRNLAKSVTVE